MYLTQNAIDSLGAVSLYLLCLAGAIGLNRILRSCEQPEPDRRRPRVWFVPVCVAVAGGCVILIPGIHRLVPQTWIGRGVFEDLDPQYVTPPSFARPATRDDRMAALTELSHAVRQGITAYGRMPDARAEIEWVAPEQWHVPGVPGAEFQFVRSEESRVFTLSEPYQIDGEQLVVTNGGTR